MPAPKELIKQVWKKGSDLYHGKPSLTKSEAAYDAVRSQYRNTPMFNQLPVDIQDALVNAAVAKQSKALSNARPPRTPIKTTDGEYKGNLTRNQLERMAGKEGRPLDNYKATSPNAPIKGTGPRLPEDYTGFTPINANMPKDAGRQISQSRQRSLRSLNDDMPDLPADFTPMKLPELEPPKVQSSASDWKRKAKPGMPEGKAEHLRDTKAGIQESKRELTQDELDMIEDGILKKNL